MIWINIFCWYFLLCMIYPAIDVMYGWVGHKWSEGMLSHVLKADMAYKMVSRLFSCPGTGLSELHHFYPINKLLLLSIVLEDDMAHKMSNRIISRCNFHPGPGLTFWSCFSHKNSHFWTPVTLDKCLERAKIALNNDIPCIWVWYVSLNHFQV